MNKLTAIIVEDMPNALRVLQADLASYCPEIEVIGTAGSVVAAAKLLRQQQPDILFLDILLGDGTGFDLLEIFPDLRAQIIFVTASDEFAVRAFQFAAVDYLLKPVDPERLQAAVQRASRGIQTSTTNSLDILKETIRQPHQLPKRISLSTEEQIRIVEIDHIIRCEADSNNTIFFLEDGSKLFVTRTLKHFANLLENHPFLRTHQSDLVNLHHIEAYIKKEGGYLRMKDGSRARVSVRNQAKVIGLLKNNFG
ncbi:MAG: LytTR family DNA-binding domain-containing protein [Bacteroidota bacterium]